MIQEKNQVCDFCINTKLIEGEFYKWEHYNSIVNQYFELVDTMITLDGREIRIEIATNGDIKTKQLLDLKERVTTESSLLKCAKSLTEHRDMKIAIDHLLKTLCEYYDSDRAHIFEISEEGTHTNNTYEWTNIGVKSEMQNLQIIPIQVVSNFLACFETDSAYLINSMTNETSLNVDLRTILAQIKVKRLLSAPLIINNKTIDLIDLHNPKRKMYDSFICCQ